MKKLFLSLAVVAVSVFSTKAQVTEGHLSFDIDIEADGPDAEMAKSMFEGSTMEMYFKGKKVRSEMNMGIMNVVTIADGDSEEMLMLMGGMMGNTAVRSTFQELEDMSEEEDTPEMDVELIDEHKEILGYDCKKAILSDDEGNEFTYWYTEEMKINREGQRNMNDEIPGVPLEYSFMQGPMKMTLTATNFDKKIKNADELFDTTTPDGYNEMTMEELQNMGM